MKWTSKDSPSDYSSLFRENPVNITTFALSRGRLKAQGFCLYLAALLILV